MALPRTGVQLVVEGLPQFKGDLGQANKAVSDFAQGVGGGFGAAGRQVTGFGQLVTQQRGPIRAGFGALRTAAIAGVAGLGATLAIEGARAVRQFAGSVLDEAGSSQQSLADIASIAGLDTAQIGELDTVLSGLALDPNLQVDFEGAAAGMQILLRSGIEYEDAVNGILRSTTLLENASGAGFDLSGEVLARAANTFQLQADDTEQAVNQIIGITQTSPFDLNDVNYLLTRGAGAAAVTSLEDFATAASLVAAQVGSGQKVGTGLDEFFTRLVPNSKSAIAAFEELGLQSGDFFDEFGQVRELEDIVDVLGNSIGNLTDEARLPLLRQAFGSTAGDVVAALSSYTKEEFLARQAIINNTDATEAAATRNATYNSSLEVLSDTWTETRRQFALPILEPAERGVRLFAALLAESAPTARDWGQAVADGLTTGLNVIESVASVTSSLRDGGGFDINLDGVFGLDTLRVIRAEDLFAFEAGSVSALFTDQIGQINIGDLFTGTFDFVNQIGTIAIGDIITGTFSLADYSASIDIGDFFSGSINLSDRIASLSIGDILSGSINLSDYVASLSIGSLLTGTIDVGSYLAGEIGITEIVTGTIDFSQFSIPELPDLSGVGTFFSGLAGISAPTLPDLSGVSTFLSGLTGISAPTLPDLSGVTTFLSGLTGISAPTLPDLSSVGTFLSGLSGISAPTLPDLSSVTTFLSGLTGISAPTLPDLSGVTTFLSGLTGISAPTLPDLSSVGTFLSGLSGISAPTLPDLSSVGTFLSGLSGISAPTLPDLSSVTTFLSGLTGISAPTLPDLSSVTTFLSGLTGISAPTLPDLSGVTTFLSGLTGIDTSTPPDLSGVTTFISTLGTIEVPDLADPGPVVSFMLVLAGIAIPGAGIITAAVRAASFMAVLAGVSLPETLGDIGTQLKGFFEGLTGLTVPEGLAEQTSAIGEFFTSLQTFTVGELSFDDFATSLLTSASNALANVSDNVDIPEIAAAGAGILRSISGKISDVLSDPEGITSDVGTAAGSLAASLLSGISTALTSAETGESVGAATAELATGLVAGIGNAVAAANEEVGAAEYADTITAFRSFTDNLVVGIASTVGDADFSPIALSFVDSINDAVAAPLEGLGLSLAQTFQDITGFQQALDEQGNEVQLNAIEAARLANAQTQEERQNIIEAARSSDQQQQDFLQNRSLPAAPSDAELEAAGLLSPFRNQLMQVGDAAAGATSQFSEANRTYTQSIEGSTQATREFTQAQREAAPTAPTAADLAGLEPGAAPAFQAPTAAPTAPTQADLTGLEPGAAIQVPVQLVVQDASAISEETIPVPVTPDAQQFSDGVSAAAQELPIQPATAEVTELDPGEHELMYEAQAEITDVDPGNRDLGNVYTATATVTVTEVRTTTSGASTNTSASATGSAPQPFATGVQSFGGGLAKVAERQPELVQLPNGARFVVLDQQIVDLPTGTRIFADAARELGAKEVTAATLAFTGANRVSDSSSSSSSDTKSISVDIAPISTNSQLASLGNIISQAAVQSQPFEASAPVANGGTAGGGSIFEGPIFSFADGTDAAPAGISLVGEHGPELRMNEGGERIFPNQQTRALYTLASLMPSVHGRPIDVFNLFNSMVPAETRAANTSSSVTNNSTSDNSKTVNMNITAGRVDVPGIQRSLRQIEAFY